MINVITKATTNIQNNMEQNVTNSNIMSNDVTFNVSNSDVKNFNISQTGI